MLPSLCDGSLSTAIMIISVAVCLILAIHKAQSVEEKFSVTALYPVNNTNTPKNNEEIIHITDKYVQNDDSKESNEIEKPKDAKHNEKNTKESVRLSKVNSETTTWHFDAVLAQPKEANAKEDEVKLAAIENNKQFKPSQQLGSFYDEDAFIVPTGKSLGSFTPVKPTTSFISSDNFFKLDYKNPKDVLNKPYTFENNYKPTKHDYGYDSKPTAEVPVKIPAGSLYKSPEPFRDKPTSEGHDEFGLEFSDEKEKEVKKRKNPWLGLLNLVTALLPIGIIVSALTPNIVTLESTDNNHNYEHHYSRRSDTGLPTISERCKRRLLCEIHSERNYIRRQAVARLKHCHKIECEDPEGTKRLLTWLLSYHRNPHH